MNYNQIQYKIIGMRKEHRRIGERILASPEIVVYLSGTELADKFNTSIGSIVRFAKKLGFAGYPEMRQAFKQMLGVGKSLAEYHKHPEQTILECEKEMVEKTISPSLNAQIDKAVSLIIHSDASIVAAYGFISVLVDLFVKYLLLAGINVFGTRNSYIDIISSIVSLENKKGTLIVINFMNYFRNIIKAEEEARAKGVKVIAITDTHFSPVAIRADVAIIVQLKRPGAIYTLAPVVAVIDEIGTRLSVRKKKKTDEILNLTKQISSEDIYYK